MKLSYIYVRNDIASGMRSLIAIHKPYLEQEEDTPRIWRELSNPTQPPSEQSAIHRGSVHEKVRGHTFVRRLSLRGMFLHLYEVLDTKIVSG